MSRDKRGSASSFDPHGYQPLIIDEDCLSDEDRREAIIEAVDHPCEWKSFLTPKELEVDKKPPSNELTENGYKRIEMARLGMFRAYARDKHADGRRIWFGDGVPFK